MRRYAPGPLRFLSIEEAAEVGEHDLFHLIDHLAAGGLRRDDGVVRRQLHVHGRDDGGERRPLRPRRRVVHVSAEDDRRHLADEGDAVGARVDVVAAELQVELEEEVGVVPAAARDTPSENCAELRQNCARMAS